jgi:hypothetical protein
MVVMAMDMGITVTIIMVIIMVGPDGTAIIMAEEIVTGDEKKAVTSVSGYRLPSPLPPFWEQGMEGWLASQGR